MKKLSIFTSIILFVSMSLMAQERTEDENGRPIGAKSTNAVLSEPAVFIKSTSAQSATSAVVGISYSLPEGESTGKIVVFHPKIDKELKTISLTSRSGTTSINRAEIGLEEFVVGMYDSQGKFLGEYRVQAKK